MIITPELLSRTLIDIAVILLVLTASGHSLLGEKRLIGPLSASNVAIIERSPVKKTLRFAWHALSIMILTCSFVLRTSSTESFVKIVISSMILSLGIFFTIYVRGRHIACWMLTAAGAAALSGSLIG